MTKKNSAWLLSWLLAVTAGLAQTPSDFADGVPEDIRAEPEVVGYLLNPEGEPQPLSEFLWLSTDAIDRMGLDVLAVPLRDRLKRQLEESREREDCIRYGHVFVEPDPDDGVSGDFDEMARTSTAIFEGTVKGSRAGFFHIVPGFLLSVEIDTFLVPKEVLPPSGRVLVFYPGPGIFSILGRQFCVDSSAYPRPPVPGDRLMIFSGKRLIDPSGIPMALFNENAIIERTHTGAIELPLKLKQDGKLSTMKTLAEIRAEALKRRNP